MRFLLFAAWASSAAAPLCAQTLADHVKDRTPWLRLEANSEQRQPVYLGLTPLELALKSPPDQAKLPAYVRVNAEKQVRHVLRSLGSASAQIEFWPVRDDEGMLTLALARWRTSPGARWAWLFDIPVPPEKLLPPFFPRAYRTWVSSEAAAVFTDPLAMESLYDKPVFGDCIWADAAGSSLSAGWLETASRETYRDILSATGSKQLCIALPQPSMLNGAPWTFVLEADDREVRWPPELVFEDAPKPQHAKPLKPRLPWSKDLRSAYKSDVEALSGAADLVFKNGEKLRLSRKSSAQTDHQLERLVDWLEERYAELGIRTLRERFTWRGIPQSNLTAVIPGSLPPEANEPVLLVDHIDTAFCADVFKASRRRVSAPGADDNATATAALLSAARLLKNAAPRRDIWLVHLTGEEFPADDLGARVLIRRLLAEGRRLRGAVVLDMLGYRDRGDRVFQVNAGAGEASLALARTTMALSASATPFQARLRTRFDPDSFLYNTDALIFSDAGYPVILINEHISARHNLDRPHYHETTDDVRRLDFDYAAALSRLAVETVARLAEEP